MNVLLSRLLLMLAVLSLWTGCKRRLPGPEECQRMAARLLNLDDLRLLRDPAIKENFDNLTVRCLTTPFDARLMRCLDESRDARGCFLRFEDRRARGGDPETTSPVRRW